MSCEVLHSRVENTQIFTVTITDDEGAPINDLADASLTVLDSDGVEVAGEAWPLPLTYVVDSDGEYEGTLTADLEWVANANYTAVITATAQNGFEGKWKRQIVTEEG